MDKIIFSTKYNHHKHEGFTCEGESMTQQQFKEECDVNNILAKYRRGQMITHINKHQGQFGDFSGLEDYQTSLHRIQEAEDSFNMLPSELRSRFANDPGKLIEYLSDPKNDDEAVKYGLKTRPAVPGKEQGKPSGSAAAKEKKVEVEAEKA